MSFDIPLLMVIIFLLCTTALVCCSVNRFTSFRVYAVGNRQFSTTSLVVTTLATYYGGGTLVGNLTKFHIGPFWLSWRLAGILFPYLMLSWLSIKFSKFIYHISMAETIGRVYGRYPRVIIALLGFFHSIIIVATQIHVISQVISACINSISPLLITILATLMFIAYTMFGGARMVVLTDVWQLITFVSLICLFVWFMVTKIDHPISEIPVLKKNLSSSLFFKVFTKHKLLCTLQYLALMFGFIEPGYLQPLYMSSTPAQASKVFLYAGIIGFFIMLVCIASGALVAAWLPPNLPPKEIFNYMLDHMPSLLKAALCVCLLAVSMSTADSRLHISAVMISHDIVAVLLPGRLRKNLSSTDYYRITYIAMLIVFLLVIILLLSNSCLFTFRFMNKWINYFYIPMVAAPFILAAVGFRTTSSTALIGMVIGVLTVFLSPKQLSNLTIFPSVLTNGLTMLALDYALTKIKSYKKNKAKKINYDILKTKK